MFTKTGEVSSIESKSLASDDLLSADTQPPLSLPQLLETTAFATFDEFVARLQVVWDAKWEEVYGANVAGEPHMPGPRIRCHTTFAAALETRPAFALPALSCGVVSCCPEAFGVS